MGNKKYGAQPDWEKGKQNQRGLITTKIWVTIASHGRDIVTTLLHIATIATVANGIALTCNKTRGEKATKNCLTTPACARGRKEKGKGKIRISQLFALLSILWGYERHQKGP